MLRTKKILYFIALVATLCVFSVLNAVHAQNNRISLRMVFPKEINKETKNIRTQQKFQNKNEAFDALQKNMNVWIRKGFLTVSIDSIYEDSLTVNAFINPGNKFIFDIKNVVGLENETEKKNQKENHQSTKLL